MKDHGYGEAPVNIALIKYFGKRNKALNLPLASSLSLSLNAFTKTTVSLLDDQPIGGHHHDQVVINGIASPSKRLGAFLDRFRPDLHTFFKIESYNDLPTGAGLASSASGYAALVLALDDLFGWNLSRTDLSILAREGSGSACRSLFKGFVEWQKGELDDGSDSYSFPLETTWTSLRFGILYASKEQKIVSSRDAMNRPSLFYQAWAQRSAVDLSAIKQAIAAKDFKAFGTIFENNALSMHGLMLTAIPPILYFHPQTIQWILKIWALREKGIEIYFTIDAGPNLKVFFQEEDESGVKEALSDLVVIDLIW